MTFFFILLITNKFIEFFGNERKEQEFEENDKKIKFLLDGENKIL